MSLSFGQIRTSLNPRGNTGKVNYSPLNLMRSLSTTNSQRHSLLICNTPCKDRFRLLDNTSRCTVQCSIPVYLNGTEHDIQPSTGSGLKSIPVREISVPSLIT